MREILFRGKRVDNGRWVEGQYTCEEYEPHLLKVLHIDRIAIAGACVSVGVIPETVGQYTGLKDKNGTRIFEGDIVKITGFHTTAIAAVKYGSPSEQSTSWGWYFDDNDGHAYFLMSKVFCIDYNAIVIGNIHDNPELLKGDA